MPRVASILGTSGQVRVQKLCMDSKEDRQTYEKIRNNVNSEIIDKQWNSTPKGVLWLTVEYRDLLGIETQSSEEPDGVSDQED